MRALIAALVFAVQAGGPETDAPEERRLPAPAGAVANLSGFEARSELTFASAPDAPHVLNVVFGFPDRARWDLRRVGHTKQRRVEYRFGEHAYVLAAVGRESIELTGPSAAGEADPWGSFLRRNALRQAALLWPEGAAWQEESDGRRLAAVRSETVGGAVIGSLVAELDQEGRPRRLLCKDVAGVIEEELVITQWQTISEREWPLAMQLRVGGQTIWDERLTQITPGTRVDDRFFVPGDRRALLRPLATAERRRIQASTVRSHPRTGTLADWPTLMAAGREHRADVPEELTLDEGFQVLVDPDGSVSAIDLRLAQPSPEPPRGWRDAKGADAITLVLPGRSAPAQADLKRLLGAIPTGRSLERISIEVGELDLTLVARLR